MYFYDEELPDDPNLEDEEDDEEEDDGEDEDGEDDAGEESEDENLDDGDGDDTGDEQNDGQNSVNNDSNNKKKDDNDNKDDDNKDDPEKSDNADKDNKENDNKSEGDSKQGENEEPKQQGDTSPEKGLDENQVRNDLNDINDKQNAGNQGSKDNQGNDSTQGNKNDQGPGNKNASSGSEPKPNAGSSQTGASGGIPKAPGGAGGTPGMPGAAGGAGGAGGAAGGAGAASGGAVAGGGAAAGAGGATAGAAAGLGVVLFWVFIIILVIIIVVGVVMFFVAMPGQVTAKFKKMGTSVMLAFQAVEEGAEAQISSRQIADVANYLESMGYDLKGEGFVSKPLNNKYESEHNLYYDDEQDVWRVSSDEEIEYDDGTKELLKAGQVVDLASDPIFTYIVSDNLCFLIKNFNTQMDEAFGEIGAKLISGLIKIVATAVAVVVGVVVCIVCPAGWLFGVGALLAGTAAGAAAGAVVAGGSYLAFAAEGNPNWGTGLISIYHEGSEGIGSQGPPYAEWQAGRIKLDPETKKLTIKRGWGNHAYTYDVDGWSGRYGMPLEFLLSVHIATKMPDLAIEMATTFDTDVEVLLMEANGKIEAGYKGPGMTEYLTLEELGLNIITNIDTDVNTDIVMQMRRKGVQPAEGCICCSHVEELNDSALEEMCNDEPQATPNEEQEPPAEGGVHEPENNVPGVIISNGHIVCTSCIEKMKNIVEALIAIQDLDYKFYIPYISKVTDHWFRDLYFVIDDPANTELMQVDEDYFYETKERWTIYETYKEGDSIPEGFEVGDYKLYILNEDGSYSDSPLTKAQVDGINDRLAAGETDVSKVVKKPVSKKMEANEGDKWIAYNVMEGEFPLGWQLYEVPEGEENSLQEFEGELYYQEICYKDLEQIEDGQRAQTNSKIKKMFVNKKYYLYDGTIEKANAIYEDRKEHDKFDMKKYNKSGDPRNPDLLGKVSISKDSLTAFNMLENTHTLDADYIYRDFKELIVELDYFDKEDLSDKIQKVMQWPIPDCGSSGWPIRKYEKGENFYGTLINSKVDLQLMKSADIEEAEGLLEELEDETEEPSEPVSPSGSTSNVSIDGLLNIAYDIHSKLESHNFDYCGSSGCTHLSRRPHGLKPTIGEAISSGCYNTCCATYISWILLEAGFDITTNSSNTIHDWCISQGWEIITDSTQLEAGDIVFCGASDGTINHVQMLGRNGEWLNAGSKNAITRAPYAYDLESEFIFIEGIRPQVNGAKKTFEGYDPDQAVVSPLTGKVIDHGTVVRKNEETGEEEEVEFIKIQAIDTYLYDLEGEKGDAYKACTSEEDTFEDNASPEAKKKEGYDYFYEEYQGVLDGFVLYIEGFDLTLFDGDGAQALVNGGTTDTPEVTRYEANQVYNMVDDLKEAQSIWKEDAKAAALPLITIGGDTYIKEGTVIGKTNKDSDVAEGAEANGNYIRLILRDLEDAIVEDVENYLNIEDSIIAESQTYQAQPNDLNLLARVLQAEGCSGYFHSMGLDEATADDASRATGYVLINRALNNYGGHGTTIEDQYNAAGQYSTAPDGAEPCTKCIENAEWCLTYACSSVTSRTTNQPMPQSVMGQAGFCQCDSNCWWWVDTNGDGSRTEYPSSPYDTFFCE